MTEPHPSLAVKWLPTLNMAYLHAIPQPPQRSYRAALKTGALVPWVMALCGRPVPEGMATVLGAVPKCDRCLERIGP